MLFQEFKQDQPDKLNAGLYERFMALSGTDRVRRTHYFAGRFENIYIDAADIPEIAVVLYLLQQQAGKLLDIPVDRLKVGFWFNAMHAGHRTSLHHHDEDDELLSAAYYVRVPEYSGNLVLHDADRQISIQPEEGKLVMFAPGLPHEVTAHLGTGLRLSVGMNVGPAEALASVPELTGSTCMSSPPGTNVALRQDCLGTASRSDDCSYPTRCTCRSATLQRDC